MADASHVDLHVPFELRARPANEQCRDSRTDHLLVERERYGQTEQTDLAVRDDFLAGAGWQASVVATATEALSRLRVDPRPEAVIFDIVLPDMTGFAFCEAMHELIGPGNACRRMVITGWLLSPAERMALTRHGISAIYQKPCNPDELLHALGPLRRQLEGRLLEAPGTGEH